MNEVPVHKRPTSCHICGSAEDHGQTWTLTGKGHNFWSNADARAEARAEDARMFAPVKSMTAVETLDPREAVYR